MVHQLLSGSEESAPEGHKRGPEDCRLPAPNTGRTTQFTLIPWYSAYTLDQECKDNPGMRNNEWHIEPQISQRGDQPEMLKESESDENIIKRNQAISSDYAETGYDRGHLNPNSFQCSDGRVATFTLTNAAPMDPCFNRIYWKDSESNLRKILLEQLEEDNFKANVYLVTGTVPDQNSRIPQESQRVTVPSHIWTAVCYEYDYDENYDEKSFSFGYIGKNQPDTSIIPMSIVDLNTELRERYASSVPIKIFVDDCFTGNIKSRKTKRKFLNKLSEKQRLKVTPEVKNTLNTLKSVYDSSPSKRMKVTQMSATLSIDSLDIYSTMVEKLKKMESACLLTTATKSIFPADKSDLRKRDVSVQSESVECEIVPEKSVAGWQTAADGSPCQSVSDSSLGCNCITESENKPCCSSPCLYRQERKGYWCYSGQSLIQCSPQYSLITFDGERCKDKHPCATYGYDYYWCEKASGSWDYCSPPLWKTKAKDGKYCRNNHACAKYGERKPYCYTDYDNNDKPCCISDDCFSAVNGKTCKSDHPCGYHDYEYLWCKTTDGSWDYCCTNCRY
ncbi:hypothetical protein QTP86_009300 [Hemibagrus guttatus]|nr:hypothetical protein QTP86_009300 [Hemibagrus guttatus]